MCYMLKNVDGEGQNAAGEDKPFHEFNFRIAMTNQVYAVQNADDNLAQQHPQ